MVLQQVLPTRGCFRRDTVAPQNLPQTYAQLKETTILSKPAIEAAHFGGLGDWGGHTGDATGGSTVRLMIPCMRPLRLSVATVGAHSRVGSTIIC